MFSLIVPPVFVDFPDAVPARAAAASMQVPIAKARSERQGVLLMELLSIVYARAGSSRRPGVLLTLLP
jgi:hypothetical protein